MPVDKIEPAGPAERALWYEAAGRAAIHPAPLPPVGAGQARVRTLYSRNQPGNGASGLHGESAAF